MVNSNGEDPAYQIIRNAKKERKKHLNEFKNFENKIYTKIFAKSESNGQQINLFGTPLISREGIFYLSESVSSIRAKNQIEPIKLRSGAHGWSDK